MTLGKLLNLSVAPLWDLKSRDQVTTEQQSKWKGVLAITIIIIVTVFSYASWNDSELKIYTHGKWEQIL